MDTYNDVKTEIKNDFNDNIDLYIEYLQIQIDACERLNEKYSNQGFMPFPKDKIIHKIKIAKELKNF